MWAAIGERAWYRLGVLLAFLLPIVFGIGAAVRSVEAFAFTPRWSAAFAGWVLLVVTLVFDRLVRSQVDEGVDTAVTTAKAEADNARDAAGKLADKVRGEHAASKEAPSVATNPDVAAAGTVAISAAAQHTAALVRARRAGLKSLVVGTDGRASTSKLQAALWTYALLFTLLHMTVLGRQLWGDAAVPAVADAMQQFLDAGFRPEYIALLGLPIAGAVAAKGMVSGKVVNENLFKAPKSDENAGVGSGLAEVVSGDTGQIDLLDFQYAAFNAVTLLYFSCSARIARSGSWVQGFYAQDKSANPAFNQVLPAGRPLTPVTWTQTSVTALLPAEQDPAALKDLGWQSKPDADLVVRDDVGISSPAIKIDLQVPAVPDDDGAKEAEKEPAAPVPAQPPSGPAGGQGGAARPTARRPSRLRRPRGRRQPSPVGQEALPGEDAPSHQAAERHTQHHQGADGQQHRRRGGGQRHQRRRQPPHPPPGARRNGRRRRRPGQRPGQGSGRRGGILRDARHDAALGHHQFGLLDRHRCPAQRPEQQRRQQRDPAGPADQEHSGRTGRGRSVRRRELRGHRHRLRERRSDRRLQFGARQVGLDARGRHQDLRRHGAGQPFLRRGHVVPEQPSPPALLDRRRIGDPPVVDAGGRAQMVDQRRVQVGAAEVVAARDGDHLEAARRAGDGRDVERAGTHVVDDQDGSGAHRVAEHVHEVGGRRYRFGDERHGAEPGRLRRRGEHAPARPRPTGRAGHRHLGAGGADDAAPLLGDPPEHGGDQVDHRNGPVAQQHRAVVDAALRLRLEPGRVEPGAEHGVAADAQRVGLGIDRRRQQRGTVEEKRADPPVRCAGNGDGVAGAEVDAEGEPGGGHAAESKRSVSVPVRGAAPPSPGGSSC